MDAKELMIGNLVQRTVLDDNKTITGTEVVTICSIAIPQQFIAVDEDIKEDGTIMSWAVEFVEPIPLTEEWLVKFGFENVGYFKFWGTRYFHKGIHIYFIDNEFRFYYQTNRAYTIYDSIHEIQNLYFALTNTELKIKDK